MKELDSQRPFKLREPIVHGVALVRGKTYLLTPAQRLVIRDYAGFYPSEVITCLDVGKPETITAIQSPTFSQYEGWLMPGEWERQEYIPPAFSDSVRGRHYRTVRIDLEELVEVAQNERYVEFEARERAKMKAKAERAKNSKPKKKRTTTSAKKPKVLLDQIF